MLSLDMQSASEAWSMYLQGLQEVLSEAAIAKICGGAKALCNSGLAETLVAHFFGSLEAQLRNEAVPELRRQLSGPDSATDLVPALAGIGEAVELQRQRLRSVWQGVVAAGANGAGGVPCTLDGMLRWHETILAAVLTTESAGIDLRGILRAHYRARIAGYSAKAHSWSGGGREAADSGADSSEDEEDLELRVDAGATPERVMGSEWVASLRVVADSLAAAGMGTLNAQVASEVVCEHLQEKISGVMGGRFGEPMLQLAFQYANAVPLEFIVLTTGSPPGDLCRHREHWRRRLGFRVYNSVAELRIGEMFDIVVDYPDSLPALEDLGTCLSNTSNQQLFVRSFSRAIQARLLHAGAATVDIIQQYVSTIKALRVLDSSGVLLEAVGGIIKEYLKGRQDAIRCVVSMLTGDDSKDGAGGDARETLLEELGRAEGAAESDGEDGETDAAALAAASEWEPDPTDADPMQSSRSRRAYDAISTLVGIYGSKELFIGEYQTMLADKLLSKTDFNTEAEIRTLELLKIRFGEACLHNCEIMLKDLADSKRIGANIKQIAAEAPLGESSAVEAPADIENFSATIISPLFWPPFRDGELKLPVEIERKANTFADRYHSLKAPRKLQFGYQLGTANLEITVGEEILEYEVSAVQATILLCFQDRADWVAEELADAVGIPVALLRRKASFWVNEGVLLEVHSENERIVYHAAEKRVKDKKDLHLDMSVEDNQSAMTSAEEQSQADMVVFESFVLGMLTNHPEMALDRIHNMLKMFATGYDRSTEQLAAFLGKLVQDEKLEFDGSVYRKKTA